MLIGTLRHILLVGSLISCISGFSGNLEKGFEALAIKDYFKAHKLFVKSLFKNPAGGSFGLSLVYGEEKNAFFNLDSANKYVHIADSAFLGASNKERSILNQLGITRQKITDQKLHIADIAYTKIPLEASSVEINGYLKRFPYSRHYSTIIIRRDSLAFIEACEKNTYQAYRQFTMDHPGSFQKARADSLYAVRFFEAKTAQGDVETFKSFINEFSDNPNARKAYEKIYDEVLQKDELEVYFDHIRSFPNSPYREAAWFRISEFYMKDYTKESLASLLWDFPNHINKKGIEEELRLLYSPRMEIVGTNGIELMDNKGNKVTRKPYDSISPYQEGMAIVSRDGKVGFINKSGDEVVPLAFDDALDYSEGIAVVEQKELYGAINRLGEFVIEAKYSEMGTFSEGLIPVLNKDGFVFMNRRGAIAMDQAFEDASDFKNGAAVVKKHGAYGLIGLEGEELIPARFEWVEHPVNKVSRVKENGHYGLWRLGEGIILECEYDLISQQNEKTYTLVKDDKIGYCDAMGELFTEIEYDYDQEIYGRSGFIHKRALVRKLGAYGVINELGEYLIEPKMLELGSVDAELVWYKEANRYGFMDYSGTKLPAVFESAVDFVNGAAVVSEGGLKGLMNLSGKYIMKPIYTELEVVPDTEFCIFSDGESAGVVHRNGDEIVKGEYKKIEVLNLRYAKMQGDTSHHYYDLDAKSYIEPQF